MDSPHNAPGATCIWFHTHTHTHSHTLTHIHKRRRLDLRFFVNTPGTKNIVTNVVPVIIIILQNIINVWIPQEPSDFLGNSSGIALNLVFLLPMMYPNVNSTAGWSFNDVGVAIVLPVFGYI